MPARAGAARAGRRAVHGIEHDSGDLDERAPLPAGAAGVDRGLLSAPGCPTLCSVHGVSTCPQAGSARGLRPQQEAHSRGAVVARPAVLLGSGVGVRAGWDPHRPGRVPATPAVGVADDLVTRGDHFLVGRRSLLWDLCESAGRHPSDSGRGARAADGHAP